MEYCPPTQQYNTELPIKNKENFEIWHIRMDDCSNMSYVEHNNNWLKEYREK